MFPVNPACTLLSKNCRFSYFVLCMGCLLRPAAALTPLPLHTTGNQLYDSLGHVVVLKGVNVPSVEWLNGGDHVLQTVDVAIRRWHAGILRLPIAQDRWEGKVRDDRSGPDISDGGESYRRLVDRVVATASGEGAYVIVDLHWSDMGVWGKDVTQHRMPDDNTSIAWASIARRYANNPAVLFDAYNEPHDVSWAVWRNGGRVDEEDGSYDTPGMQALVNVIRGEHAGNVIVVGGLDFSFDLRGIADGYALAGSNLVYACHAYPSKSPDWDLHVAAAARIVPVVISEFGADGSSAEAASFTPRLLAWVEAHHYSAIAWCMHTSARPCLISDWAYEPTYGFGDYVFAWLTGGPPPPSRLECDGRPDRILLSWNAVPGAESYSLRRTPAPLGESDAPCLATGIKETHFSDDGLPAGSTYYYQVTARGALAEGGPSNERGATVGIPGGFEAPKPAFAFSAQVPGAPVGLHSPAAMQVTVTDVGRVPGKGILIAMQVHDSAGRQVYQKIVEEQDFSPGQSRSYPFPWTPTAPGTYVIQAGAFGDGFAPRYSWEKSAGSLVVVGQ